MEAANYSPPSFIHGLSWHKLTSTWNFNRYWLLLGSWLYRRDHLKTEALAEHRQAGAWELSSQVYSPVGVTREVDVRAVHIDALVVAEHGRFGNSLRQILHALAAAERLGAREVIARSLPLFPRGSWVLPGGLRLTHDPLLRPRSGVYHRVVLGGDFFVVPRLPVAIDGYDFRVFASALGDIVAIRHVSLPGDALVAHIRSGDVFSPSPHEAMAQPPLGFYLSVIEHADPASVVLVCENDANPVIPALLEHLEVHGIDVRVQSSGFRDDLAVLLSAKTLVTAGGTLSDAILALSSHLTVRYSFGHQALARFGTQQHVISYAVADRSGEYAKVVSPWKNTAEQRDAMIHFPQASLSIERA